MSPSAYFSHQGLGNVESACVFESYLQMSWPRFFGLVASRGPLAGHVRVTERLGEVISAAVRSSIGPPLVFDMHKTGRLMFGVFPP